jgi:hypothetical protein
LDWVIIESNAVIILVIKQSRKETDWTSCFTLMLELTHVSAGETGLIGGG